VYDNIPFNRLRGSVISANGVADYVGSFATGCRKKGGVQKGHFAAISGEIAFDYK
jgi:hypothetical protein